MKKGIVLILLLFAVHAFAADFVTHTYFKNDSTQLTLDILLPENQFSGRTPLVIYVHGGGFSAGNKGGGHKLAEYLVTQNIACASIDYTLYMKGKSFSCDGIMSEKVKAIQIAANQLWHATDFLMKLSDTLNVDTTQIFIAGSSAGAETVLHAAYWNRDQMALYETVLSPDFQYAGIIAGAGAIMDLNLIRADNKVPTFCFHGDSDPVVPYGTAAHHYCPPNSSGWLMLFGSRSIVEHIEQLGGTAQLVSFANGNHSYAGAYFYQNQEPVSLFIQKVRAQEHFVNYQLVETKKGD